MTKSIGFINDDRKITWVTFTGSLASWNTIVNIVERYNRIPTLRYLAVISTTTDARDLPAFIQPNRTLTSFVRSLERGRVIYKDEEDSERLTLEADVIFNAAKAV